MKNRLRPSSWWAIFSGAFTGLAAMAITVGIAWAAPVTQEGEHPPIDETACQDCHLDIANSWARSAHAHAYDDPVFQERWTGLGNPGDCLLCHTTNYQAVTGAYEAEGVACQACHGQVLANHPPAAVPIRADTEYCGICHTTTLHEWRLTGHAASGVGCISCHDPHSQKPLFAVADNLCINCHTEDMEKYLEDLHFTKNIGCVDCHALVIPPEVIPDDGIVPTGHTFTITPKTCVACHTDALHAGFSLPGYENGARAVAASAETLSPATSSEELIGVPVPAREQILTAEQQIQALEAALASNRLITLFQGGVIGLVLGGTTAWFVAHNVRRSSYKDEEEPETT